ncbi:MAG: hypothetical protein IJX92_07855 [Clostridia bacterium]|nr:hypothetical protein [Clostridia bacterium]
MNDTCAAAKVEIAHTYVNAVCDCGAIATPGTIDNPIALEIPGDLTVAIEADGVVYYTFTITEAKVLEVTLGTDNADIACSTNINDLYNMLDSEAENDTIRIELDAGTYYVAFATANYAAETYTVSAEFYEKPLATPESIAGKYYIKAGSIESSVMAVVIDANGTITFGDYSYNYTLEDNVSTVTFADGKDASNLISIMIDEEANVCGFMWNGNEEDLYTPSFAGDEYVYVDENDNEVLSVLFGESTVTFTHTNPMTQYVTTLTFKYAFDKENAAIVLTNEDDTAAPAMYGIGLDSNLVPTTATWEGFELEITLKVIDIIGTYVGTSGNTTLTVEIGSSTIKFTAVSQMTGETTSTYYYVIENGAVVLYDENGYVNAPAAALTLDDDDAPVSAVYNFSSYELTEDTSSGGNSGDGDEETGTSGTEDNPIVLETLPPELTFTGNHDYYYTYTATEAATIVINKLAGSYVTITAEDYDTEYNEDYTNATYIISIAAGETIKLNPWVDSSDENADSLVWTYTFTVSAPVLAGSADKPVNISTYQPGSLDQPGSDDEGYVYFTYNSWMDGTLTLTFTGSVDVKYGTDLEALTSVSAQESVVINIANGDFVYVLVKGDSAVTFTAATAHYPGTENNPYVLENWAGDHTCDYTGSDVWYQITGGENGGYVTLSSTFATANLGAGSSTYSVKYSTTGNIRFYVGAYETAYIVIGDTEASASAEIAFNLSFVAGEHELDGSVDYPYVIESIPVTDNVCSFGGGYAYVWYKLNVTGTGYLTLSSATANAKLVVSSVADAWASDAVVGTEGSVRYATIGGTVYVGIITTDYEAADITFSVSFEEGELQPDGSAKLPYTAVVGENTCAFPGGADMVWYTITVERDCTLTVSSSYISINHTDGQWTHPTGDTCAWIIIGDTADQYSGLSNNLYSESSISATAGTTYYIGIADWGEVEANINFTVTVTTDDTSDDTANENVLVLGDNAISVPAGNTGVNYTFTSVEGGAYTLSAAEGEENAFVFNVSGSEATVLPYSFTLGANETIEFNITAYDYSEDEINLVLTEVVA